MAVVVNSPPANVSQNQVVRLESIITEIKQMILNGADSKQIIDKITKYCMDNYSNKTTRRAMFRNLVNSTNSLIYQYKYNEKVIDQTFLLEVIRNYKIGTGLTATSSTFTIDLTAIYREYVDKKITLRNTVEQFRGYITNTKLGDVLIKDYNQKITKQVKLIADTPFKYTDVNGRKISIRNKVEMATRYQANQKDIKMLKDNGVKLVWTSSHANASPRCAPYQGKLYSLDGTSGTIDGIKYTPLDDVLKLNGGNSIINGYNCRHYLIEYEKGSKAPRHFSEQEMEKEYAIDIKQRNLENRIRQLKIEEACYLAKAENEENEQAKEQFLKKAKVANELWNNLYIEYDNLSRQNNRATFRWRTEISTEEVAYEMR